MFSRQSRFYLFIGSLILMIALMLGAAALETHVAAQDDGGGEEEETSNPNLLVNGSLERPYAGQGSSTRTVPQGWQVWVGAGAPDAFPHTDTTQVIDGAVSWNIKQGYTVFTVAGYQVVGGLTKGDVVKLTAYGWVYTCNNTETSCVIEEAPYRQSDTSAGASLKVGIDPAGGTNPNAESVKWSAAAAPYDQWAEMSVNATAEGSSVTVFLYATQSNGLAINNVYWDNASLVRTEEGEGEAAAPAFVPFVAPQGVRPDGSIIHTVQTGDTLSSIAYAYAEYGVSVESIAELNENLKPNTRFLQVGQEIVILPPGSVDPVTGQLVPEGAQPPAPQPTAAPQQDQQQPPQQQTQEPPQAPDQQPAPPVEYAPVQASYMPFEGGFMFWVGDTNQIYVLTGGADEFAGTFNVYQDTWREGMPETDPNIQAPEGFVQPARGFGQAWRTYPGVRDSLGWGTSDSQGYTALVVRDGEDMILSAPNNRVYRMLADGTWEAVDLFLDEAAPEGDTTG